ncbi:MAG TPA: 50S ribosomal protein L11 methyltransferase [Gammaproteobacteria bacterium]|nr:50S ribosomal protein L11 methyltransferase [Gammaproteobacteria bacterium]
MPWQKLTLYLPSHLIEPVDDLLNETGALSVTLESAQEEELFEPPLGTTPLWQQTCIKSLFTPDVDISQVLIQVSQAIAPYQLAHHSLETLPDQDWQKVCTDSFQAICFADKLWVYPSWSEPPATDKPSMILDPGLAFGTGSHPTTALCLKWLAQHIQPGQQVIDYGCGSGILAIAALKLGASQVWAVDNDPQAIEATLENAHRNGINLTQLHTLLATTTPPTIAKGCADVLIANILANPLISLAAFLENKVKSGGHIVLSGILSNQAEAVKQAYAPWFKFSPPEIEEDWVRLCAVKIWLTD